VTRSLVTGGAGFIGLHLTRALADAGGEVVVVDDLSRGSRDAELDEVLERPNVSLVSGDVTREATWQGLGGPFDEAFHLAAVIGVRHVLAAPARVLRVNALGTIRFVDWLAAGGAPRAVFASTSEVYAWAARLGDVPVPTPEAVPVALPPENEPRASYAASKIFGEQLVRTLGDAATIVRYHNVYGPRMGFDHVVPEVLERLLRGDDPVVVYAPDHRRAFCYVDDAVRATIASARAAAAAGETVNVGAAPDVSILELAQALARAVEREPLWEGRPAPHDPVTRRAPDLTRARELLGYEPAVSLEEGIAATAAWYAPRLAAGGRG
jgi:nucleoside-diphosphate-sugar epimerase